MQVEIVESADTAAGGNLMGWVSGNMLNRPPSIDK